ncbi:hypothetical protein [Parasphingorhabdus sp.]
MKARGDRAGNGVDQMGFDAATLTVKTQEQTIKFRHPIENTWRDIA